MEEPRIEAKAVRRRMDDGEKVFFLDARSAADYEKSDEQLPGAKRVPTDDAGRYADDFPGRALLVAYCNCPSEESSMKVARVLRKRGRSNVFALTGGMEAWVDSGGETEPKTAPLEGIGGKPKGDAKLI